MNLLRCRASWLGREKHLLEKSVRFFFAPTLSVGTPQNAPRVLLYGNVCLVSSKCVKAWSKSLKKPQNPKSLSMAAVRGGSCVMANLTMPNRLGHYEMWSWFSVVKLSLFWITPMVVVKLFLFFFKKYKNLDQVHKNNFNSNLGYKEI